MTIKVLSIKECKEGLYDNNTDYPDDSGLKTEAYLEGFCDNIRASKLFKIYIEDARLYIDTLKERGIMTGFLMVDEYLQNVEKDKHVIIINSHGDMIAGDSAENILTNEYYYLVKDAFVICTADAADRLILYTLI